MILNNIVPWGRNKKEYIKMFNLSGLELNSKILGCGDGPSSFNSECFGNVTSIDPIYSYTKKEIQNRIEETCEIICDALKKDSDKFNWVEFKDLGTLKTTRLNAMDNFLEDYNIGKEEGRYTPGALPALNFSEKSFDLVLSSHFLFLYSEQLSLDFHIDSIKEMLRVGQTVRIFPICDLEGVESKYIKDILVWLKCADIEFDIVETDYEFQKGGNKYLEIIG